MKSSILLANVLRVGDLTPVDIHITDGRIERLSGAGSPCPEGTVRFEGAGLIACPGFIDLHVHGGRGFDFMDASEEAFETIGAFHAAGGTTSYLPTTAAESSEAILACLDMADRCRSKRVGGVEILGVHLEGPFMAPTKHGCHHRKFVRQPTKQETHAYLDRAHVIKRITCAPEVAGVDDVMRSLSRAGLVISGGHSEATCDETLRALDDGMTMITHLYSAMSTITKRGPRRVPGMLEATLLEDRLTTELILDLHHVSPELVRLALKAKPADTICFVTDAMRGAGMPDGTYAFGSKDGTATVVENGVARNLDNTGFASSTVRMIDLVSNAVEKLGMDLADAVQHVSAVPARILGLADRKGSLDVGKDGDVVLLERSQGLRVRATIAAGELIWRR